MDIALVSSSGMIPLLSEKCSTLKKQKVARRLKFLFFSPTTNGIVPACSRLLYLSFASPASTGSFTTLSDLYVKPCAVPYGSFHACVVSPGGNMAETFALAIDQLRLLRNSLCHSTSSEMDKPTFDQRVNYTRDAFQALGVSTAPIDAVVSLAKSDFPTNEIRKLEARIRDETRAFIKCLEDFREGLESLKQRVEVENASKDDITRLEKKIDELKAGRDEHDNLPDNSGKILRNCSSRRLNLRFGQIVSKLQLRDWLIQPVPFTNNLKA